MTSQPDQYELEVFDSNSMDWLEIPIEQIGKSLPLKLFTADPDTGMSCALLRYDAGFINPWHTHMRARHVRVKWHPADPRGGFRSGEFCLVPRGDDDVPRCDRGQ